MYDKAQGEGGGQFSYKNFLEMSTIVGKEIQKM
jgi:hypothetical protein